MNGEEYNALLQLPGYVGISYRQIRDAIDPLYTPEGKQAALARLFQDYGLDITQQIQVGRYFDARMYSFHYSDDRGQLLTPDDFREF